MSKQLVQALDSRPAKTDGPEPVKGASPDVINVSGGVQADQVQAGKVEKATNGGASPQGALPVLSIPGVSQTASKPANQSGEETDDGVSSQGVLPVISVPGGS